MSETNKDIEQSKAELDTEVEKELAEALGETSHEAFMEKAATGGLSDNPPEPDAGDDAPAAAPKDSAFNFELRRGRITAVTGDDVFVELVGLPGKNQGICPGLQFERPPRIGSIMDFVIERFDDAEGLAILSREGAVTKTTWDHLAIGSTVEARVTGTNKGGLELEMVGGIKAFMPASQVDVDRVESYDHLVGEKLTCMVQEIDRRGKKVLLSRRRYLEAQRKAQQEKLLKELVEDQVREGKVRSIVEFGAFVDLGGIDGLLHISDLAYNRVKKVEEVVKVGDTVKVKVLKVDKEKARVSLGLKQVQPDPWETLGDRMKPGDQVSARVTRIASFGAFLEMEEGVEGLLPLSEMSWKRIGNPNDVAKEGDVLKVIVLDLDASKRRLTFSIKQVQGDPWTEAEAKYPRNSVVEGRVARIVDFGAFVEFEVGVEGMVHISELANKRVNRVEEIIKVGEVQKFRVLEVDPENRRLKISLKAVDTPLPEEDKAAQQAAAKAASKRIPRENLGGGLGSGGGMGIGLGQLKL